VHQAYFSIDKAIIFVDKYNFPVQLRYKSCTKKLYEMNKLKSIFRLSALCLILSAGLFACKSSKKMADVSNDADTTEEQQEKPDNTTVDVEMKGGSDAEKRDRGYGAGASFRGVENRLRHGQQPILS
jgi:hypothetical protein